MAGDEDARIINAASLSRQLVDRVLAERTRQVDLIATSPSVIAAARKGSATSRERGLPKMPIDQLETMFDVDAVSAGRQRRQERTSPISFRSSTSPK